MALARYAVMTALPPARIKPARRRSGEARKKCRNPEPLAVYSSESRSERELERGLAEPESGSLIRGSEYPIEFCRFVVTKVVK